MKVLSTRFEDCETFEDAESKTTGYSNKLLLNELPRHQHSSCLMHENAYIGNTSEATGMAAFLSAASYYGGESFVVVDIGGQYGNHYGLFRKLYRGKAKVEWHVIETDAYVKYSKEFITDPGLFFHTNIDDIGVNKVNIVHFGGVLGYLPDPFGLIDNRKIRQSDFIILNRTPVVPGNAIIAFAQFVTYDIGEVSYAGRAIGSSLLQSCLEQTHSIEMSWVNHHETFRVNQNPIFTGSGMLCRRKGL